MSLRSDWPCWEIMKCDQEHVKKCPAYHSDRDCWEIMREIDVRSFNVCKDCIVYVTKQENSMFTREEILSIMCQKGVDVVGNRCPGYNTKQSVG